MEEGIGFIAGFIIIWGTMLYSKLSNCETHLERIEKLLADKEEKQ